MEVARGGGEGARGGKCFKQVGGGRGREARGRVKGERNVQGNRMGKCVTVFERAEEKKCRR